MNISELDQEFDFVDTVTVERNEAGRIDLKMPQHRYEKSDKTPVHRYGWGPFCKFHLSTSSYQGVFGVYIFTVNHQIVYIGEAIDIHSRIYGYSNISPKNCFKGGQQTNCRINNAIFETVRNRGQVALWATEAPNRKEQEAALIEEYDPPWNFAMPSTMTASTQETTDSESFPSGQEPTHRDSTTSSQKSAGGKYEPLYSFLENADTTTVQLSFDEIEEILDAPLPSSARDHKPWWHPAGHSHAKGWAELGWSANPNLNSETVVFEKIG